MSASMYNSPYTFKESLPPIEYPPMFSGLSRISFRHILDSKFLAISAIIFFVALLIGIICVISPFWFKLVFSTEDGTFGTEPVKRQLTIDTGIFFINDEEFDNLVELDKNNNQDVVPRWLVLGQVLQVAGICMLVACLAGCVILVFRRFGSPTANFVLAFFSSLTGVILALVFVCALIMSSLSSCDPYDTGSSCNYKDNLKWRVIPVYSQMYRIEPLVTPYVKLNWTLFISLIVAILVLVGSVVVWIEAFKTYSQVSRIRYQQLRTARNPHEGDVNPETHGKYSYQPPVQAAPGQYGMQPVTFQGGPYGGPAPTFHPPSAPSRGVGFEPFETKRAPSSSSSPPARRRSPPPRRRSPSPPSRSPSPPSSRRSPPSRRRSPPRSSRRRSPSPPSRRGPPSVNSSVSEGPYMSREIDL